MARLGGSLAVLVIIVVGGVLWYFQAPPPPSPQPPPPVAIEPIEDHQKKIEALQRQIDAIQAEIGKMQVLSLIAKLEDVQRQIDQNPEKTALLQTQIEHIYSQLVENIGQQIDRIQAKIGTNTILSLATELKLVQKHMMAIHVQRPQIIEQARQTQIDQIFSQLVENLNQEIDRIQAKIGTNTILDLATELESVQKAMKVIQTANGQLPKTSQKIELLQTQTEQIYRLLVKEIQKPLEEIMAQVGQRTTISLSTQLEKVQKQLWTIQGQIGRLYGTQSLFYAQVSELQTRIEQIYAQLVEKINKKIDDIHNQPIRGISAVISLTTQLADIQELIDAVQKLLDKLYEIPQVIALQKQVEKQQTGIEHTYRLLVIDIEEQIEAMPADKCAEQKSLRPQIETLQTQIERIQQRIDKSVRSPEMAALKTRLDGLDIKIMGDLTEVSSCSCVNKVPKCLSAEMQRKLPLSCVPTMQDRSIPDYLHNWMKGVDKITESEFFVMRREVKVGEFQDYVETLDKGQKEQLGTLWRQEYNGEVLPDENPVASVPWWAAKGYADWLSKETGCPLTLPSYNQWVAATISYADPKMAVIRDKQRFLGLKPQQRGEKKASGNLQSLLFSEETEETSDGVLDLLGNLREWSTDSRCPDESYHYILGEDYNTWRDNIGGEPICEMGFSDMVGFRLVLREKK